MKKLTTIFALALALNANSQTKYTFSAKVDYGYMFSAGRVYRSFGSNEIAKSPIGFERYRFNASLGWQIPNAFFGLGVGYESNTVNKYSRPFIPLFAHANIYILDKKISPYIIYKFGYGIMQEKQFRYRDGLMTDIGAGVRFKYYKNFAAQANVVYGYRYYNYTHSETGIRTHNVCVSVGLDF